MEKGHSYCLNSDGPARSFRHLGFIVVTGSIMICLQANAQFSQQGSKLFGTGAVGAATQGRSVSLSSDGKTAIVGGEQDSGGVGAAWVFTRSGGVWTQQGGKLVGSGSFGSAHEGNSVSLSADGNTAIVGGDGDSSNAGAAWIFIRSTGVWAQQGSKLFGIGAVGHAQQGSSVSLSADGNTAIVGGFLDSSNAGAAWVFVRSSGVWSQQGSKLFGTGAVGSAQQGTSVSLSSDGNTAIVGGGEATAGAAWVFIRSSGVWTQQGSKLFGTGAVGNAAQGNSVSLSSDGNTAIVGGHYDSSLAGAAWVYTRSGGVWTQQGSKLVGTGAAGSAQQGYSVSLSSDGNTAVVGGNSDNSNAGAVWVYARSSGVWTQQGSKLVGTGAVGSAAQGISIAISGDGNTAIVGGSQDNSNAGAAWIYATPSTVGQAPIITSISPTFGPIGTIVTITGTNFNTTSLANKVYFGAVKATISSATSSSLAVVVPIGATFAPITVTDTTSGLTAFSSARFVVTFQSSHAIDTTSFAAKVDFSVGSTPYGVALGDVDGDGKADLVVTNQSSNTVSVFRNISTPGSFGASSFAPKVDFPTGTEPIGAIFADVDGDGKLDLIVANETGNSVSVFRNTSASGSISSGSFASKIDFTTGVTPLIIAVGDLDGDGKPDIVVVDAVSDSVSILRNTSTLGSITSGSFAAEVGFVTGAIPNGIAIGDLDGDGKPDLVVTNNNSNSVSVFRNIGTSGSITTSSFAAKVDFATGTNPIFVAIGDLDGDGKADLAVANNISNNVSVLRNTSSPGSITGTSFAAKIDFAAGVNPVGLVIGDADGDGKLDLMIANQSGNSVSLLRNTSVSGSISAGSFASKIDLSTGALPSGVAFGDVDGDGRPDLLVSNYNGNSVSILRNKVPLPTGAGSARNVDSRSGPTWAGGIGNYATGVFVHVGDSVKITASGSFYNGAGNVPSPDGFLGPPTSGHTIMQVLSSNALVGGIALTDSQYFRTPLNGGGSGLLGPGFVGSNFRGVASDSGQIYLAINDTPLSDNVGFLTVNITVPNAALSVQNSSSLLPQTYSLSQNYPNPFNPSTTLRYGLWTRSRVRLIVYNILGQIVADLVHAEQAAGWNQVVWNANNASGLYFYRLEAISIDDPSKRFIDVKKMILLK